MTSCPQKIHRVAPPRPHHVVRNIHQRSRIREDHRTGLPVDRLALREQRADALLGIFEGTPYEYSSEQKQMYMSDWEEEYTFDVPNPTRAWQFRTSEKLFWVMACDTDSDPFFLVGLSNANGSFDAIIHEDNDPLFLNQHGVVYLPW